MHRFGRSGQLKKDRWGGSFILIAGLALAAAYFTGDYLQKNLWGDKTAATTPSGNDQTAGLGENLNPIVAVEPEAFNLYAVQVGAFKSPTGANNMAQLLNSKGKVGFANINTNGISYAYAGGVFTEKEAANKYLADLKAAKVVTDGFIATLKVPYGPDAITAMAGETNKNSVQTGYSSMNTYLHEVALWIENRANGQDDPVADLVSLGKSLGNLATEMEKTALTDEKMKAFVAVAREAGQHAELLKSASSTQETSAEYMKALNGYVSLLAHYNNLQANTTASTTN